MSLERLSFELLSVDAPLKVNQRDTYETVASDARDDCPAHNEPAYCYGKENNMTDCSQLPAELADAEQQRDALPKNPIQYCLENSDNLQEYKACSRDLRQ